MKKSDIITFFDNEASSWDERQIRNENAIKDILDMGDIEKGKTVLDVACGTGVLFNDYIKRNVKSVLGIDISSNMVKIAKENYKNTIIDVVCDDVITHKFTEKFDCIMVHNAFPHFKDSKALIEKLSTLLNDGGRLTIAHSMSKAEIDKCHEGKAHFVSVKLMDETDLAELMSNYLSVDTVISDDEKYIVSGLIK